MANSAVGIIFSNLNDNTLSRLTSDRTVAAIPFACRYRLIDFCLSNLTNAAITNINVIANYNYRSLVDHIGSGKDWDLARRTGGINIISPYSNASSASATPFTTRIEALKSMLSDVKKMKEEYAVLMDADQVLNIDIEAVIEAHKLSGAKITAVTRNIPRTYTSKNARMAFSVIDGVIDAAALINSYDPKFSALATGIFVMRTEYLQKLIETNDNLPSYDLFDYIIQNTGNEKFCVYPYSGYVAALSSLLDYYECSIELLQKESARESLLFKKELPIFTRVHNSAPTLHKNGAFVENSMIADECVIEGSVVDSIVFRGVHVERGATVKSSVLFHGTHVGKGASLNCIVTDKDVFITDGVCLSGNYNMPFYIQKNRKI